MFVQAKLALGCPVVREGEVWQNFRAARASYDRVKRRARAAHDTQEMRENVARCRADARLLWRMIEGRTKEQCPVTADGFRDHFATLLNDGAGGGCPAAAHCILGSGGRMSEDLFAADRTCLHEMLNSEITLDEVTRALARLPNGKAAGLEKVPSECYKYAVKPGDPTTEPPTPALNRVAPLVHVLFNKIWSEGAYPEQFTTTVLTPIYKRKGDVQAPGNYRGIAVGGALAKCYASILLERLANAGEEFEWRHTAQAGFRRKYGTTHHLFVLRHLINKHTRAGATTPLIVVQIDFEKAFDKVPRPLIWMRLEERGVTGEMLAALKKAYERVMMGVKAGGKHSAPFATTQGVKQGCPLSTELFGLFIETLAEYIDSEDTDEATGAPEMNGKKVSLLMYADDVSLLATTPERMRHLLSLVDTFCLACGMKANVTKCERLVFAANEVTASTVCSGCQGLKLAGQPIPAVDKARYLGLVYGPGRAFVSCRETLCESARRAMCGLNTRLNRLRIFAPDIRMRCFDVQIRSILAYGCEVWGPDVLVEMLDGGPPPRRNDRNNLAQGAFEACLRDEAVKLQAQYMRQTVGAAKPSHRLLFAELAQLPLHFFIAKQCLGFYNRISAQNRSLAFDALVDEAREAWANPMGDGWCARLFRFVAAQGVDAWHWPGTHESREEWRASTVLPDGPILSTFRGHLTRAWEHERLVADPHAFPSDGKQPGIHMCKHKHWMGLSALGSAPPTLHEHSRAFIPVAQHKLLMRFRLCCWPITANRAWERPREERTCPLCTANEVEDEHHVLMQCAAYTELRACSGLDFSLSMREVMLKSEPVKLAALLSSIWEHRSREVPLARGEQ